MTLFDDAAALLSAAIGGVFDEQWQFLPKVRATDVNARPSPDGGRLAVLFAGAFLDTYARAHSGPARTQGVTTERPGHASDRPQISFDPSGLPYAAESGDCVKRMKTGEVFRIAEPRRDLPTRVVCDLTRV